MYLLGPSSFPLRDIEIYLTYMLEDVHTKMLQDFFAIKKIRSNLKSRGIEMG